jgi:predicted DNA-binding transcriptional regulator AlpA
MQGATGALEVVPMPDPDSLLRLKRVLEIFPVSRSAWWKGVREGRFPKPFKLGPGTTAWKAKDVLALIESLSAPAIEAVASEGRGAPAAPAPRRDDRPDPRLGVRGRRIR